MYLDVDPVNLLDPIRLFAVVGNPGSAAYSWNIKITLIDCTRNTELQGDHLYCTVHSTQYIPCSAPVGCRQYHSAVAGVFESLSYSSGPGSPYLANTNYAVCFRPRSGFCGLRLTSAAPGTFIMNSNIGDQVSCDWWRAGHVTAG